MAVPDMPVQPLDVDDDGNLISPPPALPAGPVSEAAPALFCLGVNDTDQLWLLHTLLFREVGDLELHIATHGDIGGSYGWRLGILAGLGERLEQLMSPSKRTYFIPRREANTARLLAQWTDDVI